MRGKRHNHIGWWRERRALTRRDRANVNGMSRPRWLPDGWNVTVRGSANGVAS